MKINLPDLMMNWAVGQPEGGPVRLSIFYSKRRR